ncbi:Uncharacterised protein [Chlamydia trachomatis]|nr:Uncharacterised protein [Chlamydia trachomatis]
MTHRAGIWPINRWCGRLRGTGKRHGGMLAFSGGRAGASTTGDADLISVMPALRFFSRSELSGVFRRTGCSGIFLVRNLVCHVIEVGAAAIAFSWVVVSWGPASTAFAFPSRAVAVNRLRNCRGSRVWLTFAPLGNVIQITVDMAVEVRAFCILLGAHAAALIPVLPAKHSRDTKPEVVICLPDSNACGLERTVNND